MCKARESEMVETIPWSDGDDGLKDHDFRVEMNDG
jgi:hypothetical protein